MSVCVRQNSTIMKPSEEQLIRYSLVYIFTAFCFIFPPRPLIELGFTVKSLLKSWIGDEHDHFVYHHIRRSYATLLVHAGLIFGYLLLTARFLGRAVVLLDVDGTPTFLEVLRFVAWWSGVVVGLAMIMIAQFWRSNKWRRHPIVRELTLYTPLDWHVTANRISADFRRLDKLWITLGGQAVVVTDRWILKTSAYTMNVARKCDCDLSVVSTQDVTNSESNNLDQILQIRVTSVQRGSRHFFLRIQAVDYEELQLQVPSIRNMQQIVIRQSLTEQFLEAFRRQITANGGRSMVEAETLDRCVGCMNHEASVRIHHRCCSDPQRIAQCTPCACRPMWCLECLGKWFASKQPPAEPERWMSGQAECPTCRATFCMYDIVEVMAM